MKPLRWHFHASALILAIGCNTIGLNAAMNDLGLFEDAVETVVEPMHHPEPVPVRNTPPAQPRMRQPAEVRPHQPAASVERETSRPDDPEVPYREYPARVFMEQH